MADSTQGERVHRSSRLTAFFKEKIRKHDRRDLSRPASKTDASPARSAASSNPPAISQETNAAINADATSIDVIRVTGATETPIESQTDALEENVESDLWSRAYRRLDDRTKHWIADASKKDSGEEKTQDLIKVVREREEEYKDVTPKIKVGDQEIVWRDYANKVVAWVTAIGDISISFAPAPSSVVWSAVKVLLKVRKTLHLSEKQENRYLAAIKDSSIITHSVHLLPLLPLLLHLLHLLLTLSFFFVSHSASCSCSFRTMTIISF